MGALSNPGMLRITSLTDNVNIAPSRLARGVDSTGAAEVRARKADMAASVGMKDVDNIVME